MGQRLYKKKPNKGNNEFVLKTWLFWKPLVPVLIFLSQIGT